MHPRNSWFAAASASVLLLACGGRDDNPDGGDGGCTGVCSSDGGDAGDGGPCNSVPSDAGVVSFEYVLTAPPCGQFVTLGNAVVHTVYASTIIDGGSSRCGPNDMQGEFWVGNGDGGPGGIYIDKFCDDTPRNYVPESGQRMIVRGYLYQPSVRPFLNSTTLTPNTTSDGRKRPFGYRRELGAGFNAFGNQPTNLPLGMTVQAGGQSTAVFTADDTFSAQGGLAKPHPELLGTVVHLPGPLTITNAEPTYLLRWEINFNLDAGEQTFINRGAGPNRGFEVTGGIAIADHFLSGSGCDWRSVAGDGGTVVFPEGISGVWETYSQVPHVTCAGNADFRSCLPTSYLPLPDGGRLSDYTHAIYPRSCGELYDAGVQP